MNVNKYLVQVHCSSFSSRRSRRTTSPSTSHPHHRYWGTVRAARRTAQRLHDNAVTAAPTSAANGGIRRHGTPQSSHNQDDTRRIAGAPRCNPAAADARTAASSRAARETSEHTSHMKCCVQEVFPAGSSWKKMKNSVPEPIIYLHSFMHS